MSVLVMGNVWDLDLDPAHKLVLLAMADHADHEGGSVHPSVRLIAHKTGYSERQVQRIIRALEAASILVVEGETKGGRGHTTHYRIVTANGDILTPFRKGDIPAKRVTSETVKGDIHAIKGDIAMSPEPSREPSEESLSAGTAQKANDHARLDEASASRLRAFRERYPVHRRSGNARELAMLWGAMTTPEQQAALASLTAWTACPEWTEQNGRYVPLIAKFLAERRWESAPAAPASTGNKTVDLLRSMGI